MKDEMQLVEQGYLIEALSPRTYGDLVYWTHKNRNELARWTVQEMLSSLPLPYWNERNEDEILDILLASVRAKEKFERKVEQIRIQAYTVKKG